MTEAGIVLPWWLLSLFAGVVLTLLAWKRAVIRRGCESLLVVYQARLTRAHTALAERLKIRHKATVQAFATLAQYYGKMRYRLSIVDFMQLLSIRWQRVESLCTDADGLIAKASQELDSARMERPEAPEWVVAADAIAKLPGDRAQPATAKILRAMLDAAESHHEETLREFRWAAAVRGRALMESERYWRRITNRMGNIEAYWCDVKRASERLVAASGFVESLLIEGPHRRRALRGVASGIVTTIALVFSVALSVYLLDMLGSLVPVSPELHTGWERAWPGLVLLALLLAGTVLASACRWTDTLPRIAELGRRWRFWLGGLSAAALAGVSYSAMQLPVAKFASSLAIAGWSEATAHTAAALLYIVPLLLAFQLCMLDHWLRTARPVTSFALERVLMMALWLVGAQQLLCQGLLSLFAKPSEPPPEPLQEGIKLVSDNSGKKAG